MDYNDILRDVVNELTINGEDVNSDQDKNEDESLPSIDDNDSDSENDSSTSSGDSDTDTTSDTDDSLPSIDNDDSDENDSSESTDDTTNSEDESLPSIDNDDSSESTDDTESSEETDSDSDSDDISTEELPSMDDNSSSSEDSNDDSSSDSGEETSNEESDDSNNEENNPIEKIKKIEEELFSNLSDDQMTIKNAELKGQFMTLYSTIGATLVRINDIPKSKDNIDILKFITDKLLELREMIDFNITKAYKTRSYIENTIIYQQCIATLNAISEIISNLPNISPENNSSEAELQSEENEKGVPIEDDDTKHDIANISDISVSDYQEESYSFNSLF